MRHHRHFHSDERHDGFAPESRDACAMHGRHGLRGFGRPGFARRGDASDARGGRRRLFDGGELRLVMLLLLEAEPRHGYDLIREIETRTGGAYAPSPGVVYPTLTLFEETGLAEARASEGAKKLFAITPAGVAHLDANRAEAEAALARLDALRREDEALDTGPVFRAMSNLKAALRMRLAGEPAKPLVFAVADAIDEAARKIERL